MAVRSPDGRALEGTEIKFLDQDEVLYPHLMRLNLDFDFRVIVCDDIENGGQQYIVTYKSDAAIEASAVTPPFPNLVELESYTNDHIIQILHDTLFESAEEE